MTGWTAIVLLAAYLLVGEPLLGRRAYRKMLATLDADVPGARARFYRQWIWQGWALAVVALLVTLGAAAWTPARLGLRLPDWPHWPQLQHGTGGGFLSGLLIGVIIAAVAGVAIGIAAARKRGSASGASTARRVPRLAGNRDLLRMLPQTRAERGTFAALAVTAGVTEEIIWRGFGLTLLFALLPAVHPAVPIVLAALAFGWAHFYQGIVGVFATAVIGAVLATLFWASGSLLWPMLLHVLIDLRVLLVRAPAATAEGGTP